MKKRNRVKKPDDLKIGESYKQTDILRAAGFRETRRGGFGGNNVQYCNELKAAGFPFLPGTNKPAPLTAEGLAALKAFVQNGERVTYEYAIQLTSSHEGDRILDARYDNEEEARKAANVIQRNFQRHEVSVIGRPLTVWKTVN